VSVACPQGRALGVAAAVAATAYSTTVMPSQAANFVHLLAFGIFLVGPAPDSDTIHMHSTSTCGTDQGAAHKHALQLSCAGLCMALLKSANGQLCLTRRGLC
jgi:hypothetical protein